VHQYGALIPPVFIHLPGFQIHVLPTDTFTDDRSARHYYSSHGFNYDYRRRILFLAEVDNDYSAKGNLIAGMRVALMHAIELNVQAEDSFSLFPLNSKFRIALGHELSVICDQLKPLLTADGFIAKDVVGGDRRWVEEMRAEYESDPRRGNDPFNELLRLIIGFSTEFRKDLRRSDRYQDPATAGRMVARYEARAFANFLPVLIARFFPNSLAKLQGDVTAKVLTTSVYEQPLVDASARINRMEKAWLDRKLQRLNMSFDDMTCREILFVLEQRIARGTELAATRQTLESLSFSLRFQNQHTPRITLDLAVVKYKQKNYREAGESFRSAAKKGATFTAEQYP